MQDRLAAVGRLAAAIAHEIRNPLTSIAGSVSMLSGIPEMSEEHRNLLAIVTRESQRLNGIITDFLAYSRGKQYHFDKTDLVRLLEDTLTLMRHRMTAENIAITSRAGLPFRKPGYSPTATKSSRFSGTSPRTRSAPCATAAL